MKLTRVKSSNIKAIGYDPSTKVLHVEFHKSGTYAFQNVTTAQHEALMAAESKGQHFQKHLRHGHDFTRLEEE